MSLSLPLYRAATATLEPLAPLLLRRRARRGKEDPARIEERLGFPTLGRPMGPLVWIHGASVGETVSALPLIERMLAARADLTVLVTSGTRAAAEVLAGRLPERALHQYVPIDAPGAARRFLDHWRPDLLILLESELWPNLMLSARARGVRLALVSARFSEKTASGWRRVGGAARQVLGALDLVLPQDDGSAERLAALGARVQGRANLKLAGDPLSADPKTLADLQATIGGRPVVVSASTHPGEEVLADRAVADLTGQPLHMIAPRHPVRADAIAADLAASGRTVARRSRGEVPAANTDVYLADTLGELGLFFRLASVVVLGGGWAEGVGGHNPLEPARLGRAVVSGPSVGNWDGVFEALVQADAVRLADADQLAGVVGALLADREAAQALGARAQAFTERQDGALDALWDRLAPLVPR